MSSMSIPPTPDEFDASEQELLAGDLTAALLQPQLNEQDVLPAALAQRIASSGEALVRARAVAPATPATARPGTSRATGAIAWTGWLAAAAMLVLFVRAGTQATAPGLPAPAVVADARAALRDSLLATPGVLRRSWTPTTDSTATTAAGEVLWDPATQRGVMRFTGLASNDRDAWQYQLWIFDAERDERYPVDGGVFDVPAGTGEVIVPIRARLAVRRAVLFAVTVEAPGGVVVSSRERIAVTAKL